MDIAAGVLLLQASSGGVVDKDGDKFVFNRPKILVSGLVASGQQLFDQLEDLLEITVTKN